MTSARTRGGAAAAQRPRITQGASHTATQGHDAQRVARENTATTRQSSESSPLLFTNRNGDHVCDDDDDNVFAINSAITAMSLDHVTDVSHITEVCGLAADIVASRHDWGGRGILAGSQRRRT